MITRVDAIRYVTPLREGGSLPGIVEADDLGTYVMKFRGAGQGVKALVAEVIVGELGRRIGLRVPELRAVHLDGALARYEADEEVQDLLKASVGLNLGVDFLPGAFGFDAHCPVDAGTAATILWLDAFTANVDRSWRNPNLLVWHGDVWCVDHGAALYFHHGWPGGIGTPERFARQPYDDSDHALVGFAAHVEAVHEGLRSRVTAELIAEAVGEVPDEWLEPAPAAPETADLRAAYLDFLTARLASPRSWLPGKVAA